LAKKREILNRLLVENYAAEGKSLARVNGKVIFLEQVVPGDVVNVRVTRNKKDWAEAQVLNIEEYSVDRVQPFCQHFGVCGGCQWQMLPYEKQLQYKEQQVRDNLSRIGKVPLPAINPIIGAQKTRYYRNKIEYTFSSKKFLLPNQLHNPNISNEESVAGYHAKGFFDKIVDIQTCYLQEEF